MTQTEFDLPDPDLITYEFKAVKVSQPIGDIYVASMDYKRIQSLTYFDVRRKIEEERDFERYLGIQRPLNPQRVEQLKKYVNYLDATFPSSVILAAPSDYAFFDEETSTIRLQNYRDGENVPSINTRKLCRVIDGQHRIAALNSVGSGNFDIIASLFIGSDIADQAYVFATVNLEQTKVNRSLAIDLFELARNRSPNKTCHNIAVALDRNENGPFFKKIKRLGVATAGRDNTETITQATFVDGLIGYISRRPSDDRDQILRGRKLERVAGADLDVLVFRNMFIDGDDIKIGKIYEEYFHAVMERWPSAWKDLGTGVILSRTNGYRALSSIFGRIYRKITAPGQFAPRSAFGRYFEKVDVDWDYFNTENFKPGTSGESALRHFLLSKIDP
jgi:DGQHR domain-containing protein